MAFLTVCGLTVPVKKDSWAEETREVGAVGYAANGTMLKSRQAIKRDVKFETTPLDAVTAFFWEQLFQGLGEHWSFDSNLYGSKGNAPSSSTGLSIQSTGIGPKLGANYLGIGATYSFAIASVYTSVYSVVLWRNESGTWIHYAIIYDGSTQTVWRNGLVYGSSISSWFAASGGTITLGPGSADFDDVNFFPYVLLNSSTYVNQISSWHATNAFPDFPRLAISGDMVKEASKRTVCGVVSSKTVGRTRRVLQVSLSEV